MSLLSGPIKSMLVIVLLHANIAYGQEETEAEEPVTTNQFPQIMYMDVPLVYEAGTDPILPVIETPTDPEQEPEFMQRENRISAYAESIQTIETQGGAWDPNLVEQLSVLGDLQQQQGDHLSAIETFDRAMHINRINTGLHTTEQIPIVQDLIESYMAMEDWANADLYQNYLFFIQQKAFGPEDPRMIPVMADLGNWNLRAFYLGYGDMLGLRLNSAQLLFTAAARMVGLHFGREDERFVPYLHSVANSAFLASRNPELMQELDRPESRMSQDILLAQLNQRTPMIPPGFRTGEGALLEIISVYQEEAADPFLLAEAYANLGDWYLLFERRRVAEQQYKVAWNLLSADEDQASRLQELFGRVTPIPTSGLQPRYLAYNGDERPGFDELENDYVDLTFTVTRNGEVRGVEIIGEETGERAGQLARLRREMRRYRFRPVVQDGTAIQSSDNLARVRFWY